MTASNQWRDGDAVASILQAAGHRLSVARDLAGRYRFLCRTLEASTDAVRRRPADAPSPIALFVPGRIEVLGKHTDYAGGRSLTCATERGFCVVAAPSSARRLRVVRAATEETVDFRLDAPDASSAPHWATYPLTVLRRVQQNFEGSLRGGTIVFSSTLPQAAGMSSSSALVVAFFLALRALNGLDQQPRYQAHLHPPEALAQYLGAVESGQPFGPFAAEAGVGTFGGSQDHTAILCAAAGALRCFRYAPVAAASTHVLPDRLRFVVGVSGVTAEKTGAARASYNRAAEHAAEAARVWRAATGYADPHLGAAFARPSVTADRVEAVIRRHAEAPAPLVQRVKHFHVENHHVLPAALRALDAADWAAFGTAVDRSQRAAETLLQNQVPETQFLARTARQHGALAASSFGAGFGGAVWALVERADADGFQERWSETYAERFPARGDAARFFVERPGPAAFAL